MLYSAFFLKVKYEYFGSFNSVEHRLAYSIPHSLSTGNLIQLNFQLQMVYDLLLFVRSRGRLDFLSLQNSVDSA